MIPPRNTVRIVADAPILQYSSGHTQGRGVSTGGAFTAFVGFHSEQGKDSAFDAACKAANISAIDIRHQRQGGSEVKRHWLFGETLLLYPLTAGPVAATVAASLANGNARRTREAGIGIRWGHGEKSRLAIRGILPALLGTGYSGIVQLAVRSRMSDRLLAALVTHTRVAELADNLVNREHHPDAVGLWELALPLGPGEEESWGKGDSASVVPLQATHPEPAAIDREYIRAIFVPMKSLARVALTSSWSDTLIWAEAYAAGETTEEHVAIDDGEVPF